MQSCCCGGRQPSGIVSKKRISRPEAVGLLLKDRKVPRFIVAPDGYGKTHVAFEYACIIFAFRHVIWIRCASPCFLRNLDAGILASEIAAADDGAALVVLDGLPVLDPGRTERLSEAMDALLQEGCEVLVTCTPAADSFGHCQRDRSIITSADLLLDETEVAVLGLPEASHANIACIAWGEAGAQRLIEGCAKEDMPADMRCALFTLLVLGSGDVDDALSLFDDMRKAEIVDHLARFYTFAGIDAEQGRYRAMEVSLEALKESLVPSLDEVVGCTSHESSDGMVAALADVLAGDARMTRACELIDRYGSPQVRERWACERGWQLIMQGHPLDAIHLLRGSSAKSAPAPSALPMLAWAHWAVGARTEAVALCKRICSDEQAGCDMRASALSLLARASAEPLDAELTFLFADSLASLEACGPAPSVEQGWEPDWLALGRLMLPLSMGSAIDRESWERVEQDASARMGTCGASAHLASVLLGVAWTIEHISRHGEGALVEVSEDAGILDALSAFASRCVDAMGDDVELLERMAIVADATVRAMDAGADDPAHREHAIPHATSARMAQARLRFEGQARDALQAREVRAQDKARYDRTHPDPFRRRARRPVLALSSAPQLEIRMFGGLEARIDGESIDPRKLTRKRARTLAAALALNKGRELSRSKLCEIIWPDSDPDLCVNSFYSVWATLKRALSYEGTCPYLVRTQVGCSLDARYLVTDMEEFESTCTSLVFGGAQMGSWEELYERVTTGFSGNLLPNEGDNPYISGIRERCRSRLVDGLLSASSRLLSMEERTGALWFSREALRRDEEREDVYISLMESQIAADQRGPALETYFKCRKFLSDGLGIDPSPRLVGLYRSIIEYEEAI